MAGLQPQGGQAIPASDWLTPVILTSDWFTDTSSEAERMSRQE